MELFEFTWGDGEPGVTLELPDEWVPPGLALELHVYARREGSLAVWLLEDGTELGCAEVAALA